MSFVTIYKTFWGVYIDFDTLISISEPFIDLVSYSINFTLTFNISQPITYSRKLNNDEQCFLSPDFPKLWPKNIKEVKYQQHYIALTDGYWIPESDIWKFYENHNLILACSNLKKQIDEIVKDWEVWKKKKN
jgi:sulfur relay (sulfurtransferase) DsrC/TusE family protein